MIPNHVPPQPLRAPAAKAGPPPKGAQLSSTAYAFLQHYIHTGSGIVLEAGKQYLLEARLQPILRDHEIESLDALTTRLATPSSASLGRLVIEAMTTNETLFFRDPQTFDTLENHLLPALFKQTAGARKLRIWSAAASTGQEAYSLAMLLLEMGYTGADFEILGTDISDQVIERAREARYVQFDVNRGLPVQMLLKHFRRDGLSWQLRHEVRDLVRFQQFDLRRSARSLGKFDLILCRNVLIYFDTQTKRKILDSIRMQLSPGGALVLGCAETIINIHQGFNRKTIGQSTLYMA